METAVFSRRIEDILTDEEYSFLQTALIEDPEAGALIPGGRGLRKLRWSAGGKGKRGGVRVIYYYYFGEDKIYMIYPFKKSDQADLSFAQLKELTRFVKGNGL